jgi:hypothetical protein
MYNLGVACELLSNAATISGGAAEIKGGHPPASIRVGRATPPSEPALRRALRGDAILNRALEESTDALPERRCLRQDLSLPGASSRPGATGHARHFCLEQKFL